MQLLVFGAQGQVAQSLQALSSDDIQIETLGRPEGDITDEALVHDVISELRPDVIVNAAAYTAVDQAESDEAGAYSVNEDGPLNLAKAAAEFDIPLIHYSTDYVFDGTKPSRYFEDDPVAPLGVYGQSKEAGEEAIRTTWNKHVILRTAWVFSPYGKNFVKTMLTLGKDRDALNVVSDQIGNPTYAPDIAAATLQIARNLVEAPNDTDLYGTFHFTNSGDASWYDFATEIFRQSETALGITCNVHPIPSSEYPTPARRPANSRLDCENLEEIHDVERRPWKQALEACMRVFQNEKSI